MNNIILIGNPNVGKTTLFNALTNSNLRAGNWHGLTVDSETRNLHIPKAYKKKFDALNKYGDDITITDLPGTYTLNADSFEEKVSIDYIKKYPNDLIIDIWDSINIQKNITLAETLTRSYKNVIILINEIKPYKVNNVKTIQSSIQAPVFVCDFTDKKAIFNTFLSIFNINFQKLRENSHVFKQHIPSIQVDTPAPHFNFLEKVFIQKWSFPIGFLFAIFFTFFVAFGPIGDFFSDVLTHLFINIIGSKILEFLHTVNAHLWCIDIIQNGIFTAFASVFSFLPQMLLLLTCFNILEDIGIFSYLAFHVDGILRKIGLTGKSVFSLILSYGCNTSAVTTTRNLPSNTLRRRTILLVPFFSCSAEIPLMLSLTALLFGKYKYLIMLAIYFIGILTAFIIALFLKSSDKNINSTSSSNILTELPRMRLAHIPKTLQDAFSNFKDFASKFVSLITVSSFILWFLMSFNFSLIYVGSGSLDSIFIKVASLITPIFSPIGFAYVACIASILASIIAKELALPILCTASTLSLSELASIFNGANSLASSFSFLVFMFLFTPCIACLINIRNEMGTKFTIRVILTSIITAYIVAFITYHTILYPFFLLILLGLAILLATSRHFVIQYLRKQNCKYCTLPCVKTNTNCNTIK